LPLCKPATFESDINRGGTSANAFRKDARPQDAQGAKIAHPPPDAIEVAAARAVGLSDGFIGAGWPASRLVQDLYMRDLGLKTEFDRSDETAKLAIASAKKSVSSQADRRAWNVVSAMMWEVRMAPMYEHTALHRKYLANANVCFMAVRIAFGQDSASGDWKNAGSECVQNQATMKAEFDKK
jgi:hypothetical protein